MEIKRDQERTTSEVGTEHHELQEILEREILDVEQNLEQGKSKGVESLPKEDYDRVQQLYLLKAQTKGN